MFIRSKCFTFSVPIVPGYHSVVSTIQSLHFWYNHWISILFKNPDAYRLQKWVSFPSIMASSWGGSRSCQPQLWKDKDTCWLIASVTRCRYDFSCVLAAQWIMACSGTAQAWLKNAQNTTSMITVHLFQYSQVSIDAGKCQFVKLLCLLTQLWACLPNSRL